MLDTPTSDQAIILVRSKTAPARSRRMKMATELLGTVVNDVGNPILPENNPAGEKTFYKLFFQTETGKKLRPLLTDAVNDRVLEITTAKQAQGREITLDYFSQIIEDLLAVKDPSLF